MNGAGRLNSESPSKRSPRYVFSERWQEQHHGEGVYGPRWVILATLPQSPFLLAKTPFLLAIDFCAILVGKGQIT